MKTKIDRNTKEIPQPKSEVEVDKPVRKRPLLDTYHCEMDDGKQFDIPAPNAGRACFMALRKRRNHRVVRCWRGDGFSGRLNFDVPAHEPLLPGPKVKVKAPEQTTMDFA